jgi:hypothetical protein
MQHKETDSAPEITEAVVLSWIFVRLLTKKFEIYVSLFCMLQNIEWTE